MVDIHLKSTTHGHDK